MNRFRDVVSNRLQIVQSANAGMCEHIHVINTLYVTDGSGNANSVANWYEYIIVNQLTGKYQPKMTERKK